MNTTLTLTACPTCDAIYEVRAETHVTCERCHTKLVTPVRSAGLKILLLGLISVALVYGAVTQPFVTIKRLWMTSDATLLEAAFAFEGPLLLLSVAVLALVLLLPLARLLLKTYVLFPVVIDQPPFKHAVRAFRWSERLRPWSMAEIFAVGCGVALMKIADLAEVALGPAFWMFAVLVILMWIQDGLICRYSIWKAIR